MTDYPQANPIEVRIVRKVIRALKAAGTPIVNTYDREEWIDVRTEKEILDSVFAVDESWLYTADKCWVLIVLGNEWDIICDYTVDLEEPLKPVFDYIDKNESY